MSTRLSELDTSVEHLYWRPPSIAVFFDFMSSGKSVVYDSLLPERGLPRLQGLVNNPVIFNANRHRPQTGSTETVLPLMAFLPRLAVSWSDFAIRPARPNMIGPGQTLSSKACQQGLAGGVIVLLTLLQGDACEDRVISLLAGNGGSMEGKASACWSFSVQ